MANFIIGGLILLAVILAAVKIRRDKKNGSCCGGCSGCSSAGSCGAYQDFEQAARDKLQG